MVSTQRVNHPSLSHPMGEGWGEGFPFFICATRLVTPANAFALLT
jgi:hypothetical protein